MTTQTKARTQEAIETAAEMLDDKSLLVDLVRDILRAADLSRGWTMRAWHDAVEKWARVTRGQAAGLRMERFVFGGTIGASTDSVEDIVHAMGAYEFSRLVMAKAKEHQVIRVREVWQGDALWVTFAWNRADQESDDRPPDGNPPPGTESRP
jgi:hypothetical protein